MFAWLRQLFNRTAGPGEPVDPEVDRVRWERFAEAKQRGLVQALGPMHDTVGHAVIPFYLGGSVDMYAFPNVLPGTAFATQELIAPDGKGARQGEIGAFELIAFTRHAPDPAGGGKLTEFRRMERRLCGIFTGLANYAFQAVLNPGETCEAPGDESGPAQIVLDEFVPKRGEFRVAGERCGLLLCIEVHPTEIAHARSHGVSALLNKLKSASHYPYSDLDREPLV